MTLSGVSAHLNQELCSDVVNHILDYVVVSDFISCSGVSKAWRKCAQAHQEQLRNAETYREIVKYLFIASVQYTTKSTLSWPLSWLPNQVQKRVLHAPLLLNWSIRQPSDTYYTFKRNLYVWKKQDKLFFQEYMPQDLVGAVHWGHIVFENRKIGALSVYGIRTEKNLNQQVNTGQLSELVNQAVNYVNLQVYSSNSLERISRIGIALLEEIVNQEHDAIASAYAKQILADVKTNGPSTEQVDLISKWQQHCF